ncbi:hypothetical protein, partial [Streptomyces sp. FH025]|uniref:hypothetical protein n=1 Tax=Streptomyces sp. FH025 TaxID=2815937 RepID=UPI001ACF3121|nr:hypothetical protein [Streptomyces sp. FH025]
MTGEASGVVPVSVAGAVSGEPPDGAPAAGVATGTGVADGTGTAGWAARRKAPNRAAAFAASVRTGFAAEAAAGVVAASVCP